MVFDLSGLDFVDSSGLGMFIIARDTARTRKPAFAMRGSRGEVGRLMAIARFHRTLGIAG